MTNPNSDRARPSGWSTFVFFCGSVAVALVVFYTWVSIQFAYDYRVRECAWDLPGEGFPWLMVVTVAIGASLLFITATLIHTRRTAVTPMRRRRMIGLGLAALFVVGALAFVLGLLMGARMECFD